MGLPPMTTGDPITELTDLEGHDLPAFVRRVFRWTWSAASGTRAGMVAFALLVYIVPYGLGLAAITVQARSAGAMLALAFAALIATTFASAQPAPTPGLGTISLVLAGLMGASFEPIVVGVAAGAAGTVGLLTSYGVGATGVGQLLVQRLKRRPAVTQAVGRAFAVIRRRGAWAILVLAVVPNPLYAWSSVAAGASRMPFLGYVAAAACGSFARFIAVAHLGNGIERLLS